MLPVTGRGGVCCARTSRRVAPKCFPSKSCRLFSPAVRSSAQSISLALFFIRASRARNRPPSLVFYSPKHPHWSQNSTCGFPAGNDLAQCLQAHEKVRSPQCFRSSLSLTWSVVSCCSVPSILCFCFKPSKCKYHVPGGLVLDLTSFPYTGLHDTHSRRWTMNSINAIKM